MEKEMLKKLPSHEDAVPIEGADRKQFLSWYRSMFLKVIRQPVEIA